MKLKTTSLAALALTALAATSQAAIVFSGIANSTGFTVDSTSPLSIVNADITYNTGENNAVPGGPNYWDVMDNGVFGGTDKTGATVISGDSNTGNALLYKFTAGASTIGSISMYSGWENGGRLEQHYSVYTTTDVSVSGASTWTLLATVGGGGSNGSTLFAVGGDNSLKTTIYNDASPILASGITGLRFNFASAPGLEDWQQNGGVGYKEIDVQVIPEPSAALLGGLGMLCLLRRRRQ
jgi:hypothetical protein